VAAKGPNPLDVQDVTVELIVIVGNLMRNQTMFLCYAISTPHISNFWNGVGRDASTGASLLDVSAEC
jgi:hypothetical protein